MKVFFFRPAALTQDSQPEVQSDDDDVTVAGQDAAVVRIPRIPLVRLAMYVCHDGIWRLQTAVPCNQIVFNG
jgi:hypothetical protein